jgi:hypothetical protein
MQPKNHASPLKGIPKPKLQGSGPSSPETLQSKTGQRAENRLTFNSLDVVHGRLLNITYGLVFCEILSDNGAEFAARNKPAEHPFEAMLLELGIKHRYTRPYRPQTNGKVERFWRTLDDDVIDGATFDNLDHFANELFEYLIYYNNHRPHQALAGQNPKAFAATKTTAIQSAN